MRSLRRPRQTSRPALPNLRRFGIRLEPRGPAPRPSRARRLARTSSVLAVGLRQPVVYSDEKLIGGRYSGLQQAHHDLAVKQQVLSDRCRRNRAKEFCFLNVLGVRLGVAMDNNIANCT